MLLANFNGKEHLRHRAVSLRQHGFLVLVIASKKLDIKCGGGGAEKKDGGLTGLSTPLKFDSVGL